MEPLAADQKSNNPLSLGLIHGHGESGTPFLISVVSAVKAMRLYTDGKCALMAQTMDIEIGGALTDDTPPELSAEAS